MTDIRTQRAIEQRMKEAGQRRALTNLDKALSRGLAAETPAGIQLTKRAVAPLADAIRAFCTDALTHGKAGRLSIVAKVLVGVDANLAAYLTTRYALGYATRQDSRALQACARALGRGIDLELRAARFERDHAALYNSIVNTARDRGLSDVRIGEAVRKAERAFDLDLEGWTNEQQLQVGAKLLELCAEALDIITITHVKERKRQSYRIDLGPGVEDWFKRYNGAASAARPVTLPTIEPPVPWVAPVGGGYITLRNYQLVTRVRPWQREALDKADLSKVYTALNALQDTRWAINPRVLAVMQQAWDSGAMLDCLPRVEDQPLPGRRDDWHLLDTRAKKAWKRQVSAIHRGNAVARADRVQFARRLQLAHDFAAYPAIYFPHRLDFRGRAYPVCELINPQGADDAKALLHFADGVQLGPRGEYWLAVHGANTFGYDKVPFSDRYIWAWDNLRTIMDVAADPLANRWWTEADKPWQFLAWCFEWADAVKSGDPHTYASHLPVALDGSCNGIQHYSAMLRDPVAGAAVNLVPSDTPQDIYEAVADAVTGQLVQWDNEETDWVAATWLALGIDRKLTKRAVMVLPYGGTFRSCLDYVSEAVDERLAGQENPFGPDLSKAKGLLAGCVWRAMGDVIVSSRQAMTWVQQIARTLAADNMHLRWTAPTGFPVVQAYFDTEIRRIKTRFHGQTMQFRDVAETDKINPRQQALASAPNFVHSHDAAALMLTIGACVSQNITSFAMVHDSYGTHAGHTEALAQTLRDTFVEMYKEHDPLADLYHQALADLGNERGAALPVPPTKGDLDLDLVRTSPYFFA